MISHTMGLLYILNGTRTKSEGSSGVNKILIPALFLFQNKSK